MSECDCCGYDGAQLEEMVLLYKERDKLFDQIRCLEKELADKRHQALNARSMYLPIVEDLRVCIDASNGVGMVMSKLDIMNRVMAAVSYFEGWMKS